MEHRETNPEIAAMLSGEPRTRALIVCCTIGGCMSLALISKLLG